MFSLSSPDSPLELPLFSAFFLLSESELLPPELAPPESPLVLPTASVELPPPEEDSALLLLPLLLPSLPEVALVPESPDVESDEVALSEVADELVLLDVSVADVVAVPEDVPLVPHVVLPVVLLDVVLLVDVVDEIPEVDVTPPPVLVTITTPDEDVLDAEDLIPRYPERTSLRSFARFLAPDE